MVTLEFLDRKLSLLNIFEIISSIERTGIWRISEALGERSRQVLLRRAEALNYVPLPEQNDYGVEQHMASAQDVTGIEPFAKFALEVGLWLSYRFGIIEGWGHMRLTFDDVAVQRYNACAIGISPHKDSRARVLLIALVSLSGTAKFSTCQGRDIASARTTIETKPGDLVLMRAPGFAGVTDVERPFHSVYNIAGPRHVVALRVKKRVT